MCYTILPESDLPVIETSSSNGGGVKMIAKENKKKVWGPTLVEKRPSRKPKDGRTILEKAQERKKVCNLELPKGIKAQTNPFSILSSDVISVIANVVGVRLGCNEIECSKSVHLIQECDECRDVDFKQNCKSYQEPAGPVAASIDDKGGGDSEEVSSLTPPNQIMNHQMDGSVDLPGQWTLVVIKKKSRSMLNDERADIEY
jgi:hypothetical protein